MEYEVIKVFNNNAVLVKENDAQYVLISKGIGFSKKPHDIINDENIADDKRMFYTLDNYKTKSEIKKLGNNLSKLEEITKEIVKYAYFDLGVKNAKLYDALYDHIGFAMERLKVGLPISNPFITEITVLCHKEFEVAKKASKLLKEKLDVDIGVDEQGFIALHLYSAGNQKNITKTMNNFGIYSKIFELLSEKYGISRKPEEPSYKNFVLYINGLVSSYNKNSENGLPIEVVNSIKQTMSYNYEIASNISKLLENEFKIVIGDEIVAIIAIEVLKLIKM